MRRPTRLGPEHEVDGFDSGEPTLDTWLRCSALEAAARGTARTFVAVEGARVVGYYALAAHVVVRDALPRRLGRGGPAEVPAVLLAKLAVDRGHQGHGLGRALVGDAFRRIVEVTAIVGARFVVVDALHEPAADFYARLGFARIPGTFRLVRKVSDISRDLAE